MCIIYIIMYLFISCKNAFVQQQQNCLANKHRLCEEHINSQTNSVHDQSIIDTMIIK